MDTTIEANHLIPLIAHRGIVVEVLDHEVATETFSLDNHLEVVIGIGKDARKQLLTLESLEVLPARKSTPAEVFHGAMPLTLGVDLLNQLGQGVAKALPSKLGVILGTIPREERFVGGGSFDWYGAHMLDYSQVPSSVKRHLD
jgi:hypothetical protein